MEIEEPKGRLQEMKHLSIEDDTAAVEEQIKKMNDELQAMMEEMVDVKELNHALFYKERQSNVELQEARQELIKGMQEMLTGRTRTNIGLKRMGEIDDTVFRDACMEKFGTEEALIKACEFCSFWQDKVKNPAWHPLKVVAVDGAHKVEVIDENDESLKDLKEEWGNGVFDAVVTAFTEMNEYNPSGRFVISELWNFKENRKATTKEAISYILKMVKSLKRRRG
ncbi:hypothetical protein Hdeb2414_s0015g00439271 [Helianthus debilis subsp. tardiflorus]